MPAALIALTMAVGCESSERQAAKAARNVSAVAVSVKQKELWKDAADKGTAPGLQRVPVLQEPVTQRTRSQAPAAQPKPSPAPPVMIPAGVRNEIRVLTYPTDPYQSYTGPAKVDDIVDQKRENLRLALPGKLGQLTLLVRVGFKPLPLMAGDTVDVAYQLRRNPQMPNDVIGIRISGGVNAGAGIVHVMQGSTSSISQINIPLFNLTAQQVNQPGFPVLILGPNLKGEPLRMGEQMDAGGGAVVRVIGSTGPDKATNPGLIEGAPFTMNVMVWRVP